MAAVAIGSAVIAYYSAKWATEAAEVDGVALQERAERERILQRINIEIAEDERLWSTYQAHNEAAVAVQREATKVRSVDPDRAAILDFEYQAHIAAIDALWPLFQSVFPTLEDNQLVFNPDVQRTALIDGDEGLHDLDPEARQGEADALHRRALALVLLIVVLIGSLLILTIAQVFTRGARIVAAVGTGIAIGAALYAGVVDPEVNSWMLAIVAGAFVMFAVWRLMQRARGRLPEWIVSDEEGAEAAEATMHAGGRSRVIQERGSLEPTLYNTESGGSIVVKVLAVAIAATSLVAAGIGFLQVQTFHQAEGQAQFAQHHALMALGSEIDGFTTAQKGISAHIRAIETRIAASNIRQQRMYWVSVGDNQRANDLLGVERARQVEADAAANVDPIKGSDGPVNYATDPPIGDPNFPSRYRLRSEEVAFMHAAMQDASNEASATLTSRGRDFAFGVAILAVVLYLLGLSLVLRARTLRLIFFIASGILVVICFSRVGPALMTPTLAATEVNHEHAGSAGHMDDPELMNDPASVAAEAYATGLVGYQVASSDKEFDDAIKALEQAVEARPEFAKAYIALSNALFSSSTPQLSGYLSIDDPASRKAAIEALRQAAAHGAHTRDYAISLGFYLYRDAIDGDVIKASTLTESIAVTRRAIEEAAEDDPANQAVAYGNLGVALLAAGRNDEAELAYDETVTQANQPDPSNDGGHFWWRDQVVAGALTDLDSLATRHPEMHDRVQEMKANLIRMVYSPAGGPAVSMTDLVIDDAFPSIFQWTAKGPAGSELEKRTVVVEWYRRDPKSGEWFVLPDISGLAPGDDLNALRFSPDPGEPNGYFGEAYITATPTLRCIVDGDDYRVEIYIDGTLSATAETTIGTVSTRPVEAADMQAVEARDLGMAFCRPRGWIRVPQSAFGLAVGFIDPGSPDRTRGIFVFRVQRPTKPGAETADIDGAVDEVLKDGGYRKVLPSMTDPEEPESTSFFGVEAVERYYNTPEGYGLVLAVPNSDGSVTIAIVCGPYADFDDDVDEGGLGLLLIDSILSRH